MCCFKKIKFRIILEVYGGVVYGQGLGFIWLDDVDCVGIEINI